MIRLKWHDTKHAEIAIMLDVESAKWLLDCLPARDSATAELREAVRKLTQRLNDERQ